MRIFLVGFMGSGKSTIGEGLATELDLKFIDLDKEIEKKYGKDIAAIFNTDGEKHFRDLEKQTLDELIENNDDFVMSCGGGTASFDDNMDKMNEAGVTIYIKLSTDHLAERLEPLVDSRPLLNGKHGHELWTFIHELLQEREPDYLRAKYKVKGKDLKAADLAEFVRLFELKEVANEEEE
ncbi:MAG TPA: shikimate kinase [Bacteroidia bacterium]|jgi:shikimate kinase|nr:shikimate kinase [Bacteroidia bacterium]